MAAPLWFGSDDRPLFGWLHLPEAGCDHAVVLCPPFGYEAWCSYQTYRALAEQLVAAGVGALRLDYDSTGSSAGTYTDPDLVAAWLGSIAEAIAELRRRGIARVSLLGLRFGATLAAVAASRATASLDHLILWDPVFAGKRYARELRALAHTGGGADPDAPDDGLIGVAGTVYTKATLAELATLDLVAGEPPSARTVMVLERDDRPASAAAYLARCTAAEIAVAHHVVTGVAEMLETDNENAAIPTATLALIAGALHAVPAAVESTGRTTVTLRHAGTAIVESAERIGPCRLFAIHGRGESDPRTHLLIMLGGGTEHQVGPGRVWVDFARAMNAIGIATLRADVDGVGDSPVRGPRDVVRSYDPEHVLDVEDLVAFGRAEGYAKVVVLGLCSGAWLAVHAAMAYPIDGIFTINAQLHWQQGMQVYMTLADARAKELVMREREVEGERSGRWAYLDALGIQTHAMRWLDALVARNVRTHLAYSDNDEGLQSMRARNGLALARLTQHPLVTLEELFGIDHGMHRFRKRPVVYDKIVAFVRSI